MPNNSSTGGYLLPNPSSAPFPTPLQGKALLQFFQQIIVGITALPGNMVRPYWQTEPPTVPDAGEAWCAFKITKRPSDEYPYVGRYEFLAEAGVDYLQRHEELIILTTFYDTGSTGLNNSGGLADTYASLFRDGIAVPQNREPLFLAGMNLVRMGEEVTVPVLFKKRWQNRVDLEWSVRRQIDRVYQVLTIVSASGDINYDTGLPAQPWSAT